MICQVLKKTQTCFLIHSDMICKLLKSASHPFSIFFSTSSWMFTANPSSHIKKANNKDYRAFFFESPEVNSRCCILNACRIKEMCAGQFTRHLFGILRFNPFRCRIFPTLFFFLVDFIDCCRCNNCAFSFFHIWLTPALAPKIIYRHKLLLKMRCQAVFTVSLVLLFVVDAKRKPFFVTLQLELLLQTSSSAPWEIFTRKTAKCFLWPEAKNTLLSSTYTVGAKPEADTNVTLMRASVQLTL